MSLFKAAFGSAMVLFLLLFAVLVYRTHPVFLVVCSMGFLPISLWWMQEAVRLFDLRRPTIPGVWFFCYASMSWLPSLFIFLGFTPEGYSYPIYPGPHLYAYLWATTSVLLAAPAGIWFTNLVLHFRESEIREYFASPVAPSADSNRSYLILLGVALALTLLYFHEVKEIPLLAMFREPGNFAYLAILREESFSAMDSPFLYAYSILREALYPFLIAVALGNYLLTKRKKWLFLFLSALGAGIAFSSVSIARGPVATILLVAVAYWFLHRSGKMFSRQMFMGLLVVLAFPLLVSTVATSLDTTVLDGLRILFYRLFYGAAYDAYVYFEVVPKEVYFQHGATIPKLAWLLGMKYFDMTKYVLFTVYPNAPDSGSAGGAFYADFYANFGIPGVVGGGVLTGAIMQSIQIFLTRRKKTTASLTAYAFMFYAFFMTTSRGLPTVLLSTGVIFVLLFWWIVTRPEERLTPQLDRR
jgi:oligosaccharide repeat unit polymerase